MERTPRCPTCTSAALPGAEFCVECGARLAPPAPQPEPISNAPLPEPISRRPAHGTSPAAPGPGSPDLPDRGRRQALLRVMSWSLMILACLLSLGAAGITFSRGPLLLEACEQKAELSFLELLTLKLRWVASVGLAALALACFVATARSRARLPAVALNGSALLLSGIWLAGFHVALDRSVGELTRQTPDATESARTGEAIRIILCTNRPEMHLHGMNCGAGAAGPDATRGYVAMGADIRGGSRFEGFAPREREQEYRKIAERVRELSRLSGIRERRPLLLDADPDVPHVHVVEVINACVALGLGPVEMSRSQPPTNTLPGKNPLIEEWQKRDRER